MDAAQAMASGEVNVAPDFYASKPAWCSREYWWDMLMHTLIADAFIKSEVKRLSMRWAPR